ELGDGNVGGDDGHARKVTAGLRAPRRNRVSASSHGDELVADRTHRHQTLRLRRVALDLPAQVRDVDVAGALVADVGAAPEVLHDLAPREDAVGLSGEARGARELR